VEREKEEEWLADETLGGKVKPGGGGKKKGK